MNYHGFRCSDLASLVAQCLFQCQVCPWDLQKLSNLLAALESPSQESEETRRVRRGLVRVGLHRNRAATEDASSCSKLKKKSNLADVISGQTTFPETSASAHLRPQARLREMAIRFGRQQIALCSTAKTSPSCLIFLVWR